MNPNLFNLVWADLFLGPKHYIAYCFISNVKCEVMVNLDDCDKLPHLQTWQNGWLQHLVLLQNLGVKSFNSAVL